MNAHRRLPIISLVALVACVPPDATPHPPEGDEATVLRVVDGDTIEVVTADGNLTVRLDGINAPDRDECFYQESTTVLRTMISGQTVVLDVTGTDQFDRALALVWHDDEMVNLALVTSGHAIATTPLRSGMAGAERQAWSDRIGLWGEEACGTGPIPAVEIDFARSVVDPPGPDDERLDQEVIYLRNAGNHRVDLTGWVLRDESSRHRYHFRSGATIAAGETIGVSSADRGWDPGGSAVWNNGGDLIILLDQTGRVVAAHRY